MGASSSSDEAACCGGICKLLGSSAGSAGAQGSASGATACSPTGTPLPRVCHRKLSRAEVCRGEGGRLIFVGDVHGCADELEEMLQQEGFDAQRDTLVLVGDLVNKGPKSGEVIRIARRTGALCVRGNHDDDLLQAYYCVGKYAKGLKKYKHNALHQVSKEDVAWLQEAPLSLSFPWLGLICVHAGLVPLVPLEEQRFEDLLWLREVEFKGGRWCGFKDGQEFSKAWASKWPGPELVVFGHDSKRGLQQRPFAIGLDTGCCKGDTLTALVVDPDDVTKRRFAKVPSKQDWRDGGHDD